jgi:hypothetical protein
MTRSRKKTAICGNAHPDSEKDDKRIANRVFRHRERVALQKDKEPPNDLNEVSNPYSFRKDGKKYFNEEKYPDRMRK